MAVQVRGVSVSELISLEHLELLLNHVANIMLFEHPLLHTVIKIWHLITLMWNCCNF